MEADHLAGLAQRAERDAAGIQPGAGCCGGPGEPGGGQAGGGRPGGTRGDSGSWGGVIGGGLLGCRSGGIGVGRIARAKSARRAWARDSHLVRIGRSSRRDVPARSATDPTGLGMARRNRARSREDHGATHRSTRPTSSPSSRRVSWAAIAAGAMIALAVYFLLTLLGLAVGLELAVRRNGYNLGMGAALWAIATLLFCDVRGRLGDEPAGRGREPAGGDALRGHPLGRPVRRDVLAVRPGRPGRLRGADGHGLGRGGRHRRQPGRRRELRTPSPGWSSATTRTSAARSSSTT